ncbi:MAG TPA: hypothetical protein VIM59_10025 [Cellvibrio sp.]
MFFAVVIGCGSFYMASDNSEKEEVFDSPGIDLPKHMPALDAPLPSVKKIELESSQPTFSLSFSEKEKIDSEISPAFDTKYLATAKEIAISRSAMIDQRFAQDSSKPIVEVMNELFQEESIDSEWAYMNEKNIHSFFIGNIKFSNFSPDSIQCKSRSCQVIISSFDKKISDEIRADIAQQIFETSADIPTGIMSVIDPKTAKLIIYFQEDKI